MPTPVEHLAIAEQILEAPTLPEMVRARLCQDQAVCSAFFFGQIAPDVQVISRQPREVTHFFAVPPTNHHPAHSHMLTRYPCLAQPSRMSGAQVAFVAGYISHLLLDEAWVREVFQPVFGPHETWANWRKRLLLHNVLRAWLERRALPTLRAGIGDLLRRADPNGWLPFAADTDLRQWRDLVADQLAPGAQVRTVEIFAGRAHIPDAEFLALLEPTVIEERIFSRVPLTELERFYQRALARTLDLIARYFNGCAEGESV